MPRVLWLGERPKKMSFGDLVFFGSICSIYAFCFFILCSSAGFWFLTLNSPTIPVLAFSDSNSKALEWRYVKYGKGMEDWKSCDPNCYKVSFIKSQELHSFIQRLGLVPPSQFLQMDSCRFPQTQFLRFSWNDENHTVLSPGMASEGTCTSRGWGTQMLGASSDLTVLGESMFISSGVVWVEDRMSIWLWNWLIMIFIYYIYDVDCSFCFWQGWNSKVSNDSVLCWFFFQLRLLLVAKFANTWICPHSLVGKASVYFIRSVPYSSLWFPDGFLQLLYLLQWFLV